MASHEAAIWWYEFETIDPMPHSTLRISMALPMHREMTQFCSPAHTTCSCAELHPMHEVGEHVWFSLDTLVAGMLAFRTMEQGDSGPACATRACPSHAMVPELVCMDSYHMLLLVPSLELLDSMLLRITLDPRGAVLKVSV